MHLVGRMKHCQKIFHWLAFSENAMKKAVYDNQNFMLHII